MPHETYICRCEDVTLKDIQDLVAEGVQTVDEIKRICRCGMGPCGGKTCNSLLVAELAKALHITQSEVKNATFRPPAKNIKLDQLALEGETE